MAGNLSSTFSLNGEWDFYYAPQAFVPGDSALPERGLFTGRMAVPGYWDDNYDLFDEEDFFALEARFNPDYRKPHFPMGHTLLPHACSSFLIGSGYYRRQLHIDWEPGRQAVLTVGPAMWGCAVYCNGVLAGNVTGYSVASEFDLTSFLQSGDNELVIVVCNVHDDGGAYQRMDGSHAGIEYGTRPGQHRGLAAQGYQSERAGIGGGVSLHLTGAGRIVDRFVFMKNGRLHWQIRLNHGQGKHLTWEIGDENKSIASGTQICQQDHLELTTALPPQLWSDRHPVLYRFKLALWDGDTVSDRTEWRWGAREVTIGEDRILVNGHPTYFRGVTEHCYFAETCNPHFDHSKYRHDLGVLRKAGFNFIRCHTWCPPEPFYEACDELGFLVQTELPSVYSEEEAEAIVRMIRHHTCAVIFCEGNEKKITDLVLARIRRLAASVRKAAPGMLFNPQEAMRGVEYEFMAGRTITQAPMPHDAERLADVAEFSDVYGSLGGGFFSYEHDEFPGVAQVDRMHRIYKKPCLSHEIGILGGYLDFSLESRYANTFIGQDLFRAARDYMQRADIYQYAELYYKNNCRFISSVRKQLVENLRSCSSITGYDYLGGIDTHWHLTGYPCGIFNEFYEEKYGETIADIYRYNSESMLLCSSLNRRNCPNGSVFQTELRLSYFGETPQAFGELVWSFEAPGHEIIAHGAASFGPIAAGTVTAVATVSFQLPDVEKPYCAILRATTTGTGEILENHWRFWVFPKPESAPGLGVRCATELNDEVIDFAAAGGAVLLTGGFPMQTWPETFRTHTSGRTLGHAGMIFRTHPIWREFPHEGFGDWQLFPMMTHSTSLIYDAEMPEYRPLLELIPAFKLIRRKSMLSEFKVGHGRIIMCGLVLGDSDPAATYLKITILNYLGRRDWVNAPEWSAIKLRMRLRTTTASELKPVPIDAGGRPIEGNI